MWSTKYNDGATYWPTVYSGAEDSGEGAAWTRRQRRGAVSVRGKAARRDVSAGDVSAGDVSAWDVSAGDVSAGDDGLGRRPTDSMMPYRRGMAPGS